MLVACLGLFLVWIGGAVALQTPGARDLREPIQRSAILKELNAVLPPSGPIIQALARFDPFPSITGPSANVPAPDPKIARDPDVAAARRSVVRVLGTACGLGVQGSGWVARRGVVVTNAHVVAGQDDTTVQLGGEGPGLDAEAIWFDPRNDLAILRVPGISGVRSLAMNANADSGTAAAVLGFPQNGSYTVSPARLGGNETVVTQDAYGRGPVSERSLRSAASSGRATRADRWSTARAGCSPRSSPRPRAAGAPATACRTHSFATRCGGHAERWTRGPARGDRYNSGVRGALLIVVCCAAAALAQPAAAVEPAQVDENPCISAEAAELRCPDLVMRRPYGLYTDRLTKRGHTVLRAGNVIDSVGAGPAELYGTRIGPRFMRARQRIYTRDGGRIGVATGALLQFKFAHQSRYWWKFYNAARFELWRVDGEGRRLRKVRTGPKVAYCLRDLTHTRPMLSRSPRSERYPACSNRARAQHVTLGTSPGWADIYPPAYPEQWIDVTGLHGCFAYVHIADPENGIFESNEDNNEAQVIIRLPYRSARPRDGCRGWERGRAFNPNLPY